MQVFEETAFANTTTNALPCGLDSSKPQAGRDFGICRFAFVFCLARSRTHRDAEDLLHGQAIDEFPRRQSYPPATVERNVEPNTLIFLDQRFFAPELQWRKALQFGCLRRGLCLCCRFCAGCAGQA